ncbi:hypothetical protein GGTG_10471 [Gaeumannomyces tritici R3-111a-1]|uniref:Uncharacterized protein n=1 Tax=Gaeumannomyces tritici (strain R3-111a-1) TaxID=644352 RepID=J3PAE5_GAET3|nr:hypothetical protein GGTG_10471 [Gaeumannomyces tritici R3-111a-1]EJT71211.1 hypothetical protein GGTG_10471 [Gaeumannomyces tritici R3-111a-1]
MIQGADSPVGNRHSALPPSPLRARGAPPSPSPRQAHVDDPDLPFIDDAAEPSRARPGLKRSLGVLKVLVICGGTLAIFALVGFLAFIWKNANDATFETSPSPPTTLWRRLLNSGRLLQIITVSTVMLRFLAALQVGVMTQMLSSLVLERGGCSLKDLALLSLMRAETSGPFGEITFAIWRQRGLANRVLGALLFLLLIVSGVTQFSSTLLVTDISTVKVLDDYNISNISVALQTSTTEFYGTQTGSYWATRPPAYPRFAEDPGSPVQGEDYYDTGTTIRAFLPVDSSSQRTAMRSYEGVTSAFDARVVCVRPQLTVTSFNYTNMLHLEGTISWNDKYEGVQRYVPRGGVADAPSFSCKASSGFIEPNVTRSPEASSHVFMCVVGNRVGFIDGKMRPDFNHDAFGFNALGSDTLGSDSLGSDSLGFDAATDSETSAGPASNLYGKGGADGYLLFNMLSSLQLWIPYMKEDGFRKYSMQPSHPLTESNSSGMWQSLRLDGSDLGIDATLCFINSIDQYYHITADSPRDGQEPAAGRDAKTGEYVSEAARDFLGATLQPRTPEERGLLRLHPQSNWTAASAETRSTFGPKQLYEAWTMARSSEKQTTSLDHEYVTTTASGESIFVPHRGHSRLFQSVMAHTGNNAALGLQALFTGLMQMAYYDVLPECELKVATTTLFSKAVLIPNKWDGFYIFCGVFAAHLVLMLVITAMFLGETRMSFLGSAWPAVAQVVAGIAELDVREFKDKTDDEVKEDLRRRPDGPPVFIRSLAVEQHKEGEEAEESGYEGSRNSSAGSLRRVSLERPPAGLHSHVDGRAAQGGGEAERSVYGGPHRDNTDSLRRVSLETSPARSYSHVGRRAARGQGGDGSQWV